MNSHLDDCNCLRAPVMLIIVKHPSDWSCLTYLCNAFSAGFSLWNMITHQFERFTSIRIVRSGYLTMEAALFIALLLLQIVKRVVAMTNTPIL